MIINNKEQKMNTKLLKNSVLTLLVKLGRLVKYRAAFKIKKRKKNLTLPGCCYTREGRNKHN